jgi:hypothetical protein
MGTIIFEVTEVDNIWLRVWRRIGGSVDEHYFMLI